MLTARNHYAHVNLEVARSVVRTAAYAIVWTYERLGDQWHRTTQVELVKGPRDVAQAKQRIASGRKSAYVIEARRDQAGRSALVGKCVFDLSNLSKQSDLPDDLQGTHRLAAVGVKTGRQSIASVLVACERR